MGAEIVSADSRTVFRGLDVGTAKPSIEEREGVPHFGFDLVCPGERFTVKDWKDYAEKKIADIEGRGRIPIVAGGTGLYVDALVFDYKFESLGKGYDKSRGECIKNLNGALGSLGQEDAERYPDRQKMCSKYKVFGISWEAEKLRERLLSRADKMFNDELYAETEGLVKKVGEENMKKFGDVYEFAWKYMRGELSREEAVKLNAIDDWHLAKRQLTWFKRNKEILWVPLEKMEETVLKCIQNEQGK
ncbi:tRNA (adenosine(37)-N6)-dimethylallyltransferase MiaA [Candidatus Saccharibacteria bacterium]|nr:tRNA (adenosine(37)-N6)-dimethylallyltransferase MiaA [Candidatus Saccharibacteria bacterium]